ncbi:hypothetical protein RFI_04143, partial [Reticulomyxa filosa]
SIHSLFTFFLSPLTHIHTHTNTQIENQIKRTRANVLLIWCTNPTYFGTFCGLVRRVIDWKALFEWLLIVGEKKLGPGAMISFGTSLLSNYAPNYLQTKEIPSEVHEWINILVQVASDPTQGLCLRKYTTQVLEMLMDNTHFVIIAFGAARIWTLAHALFYRYHIGIHVSYQTVRDKLVGFISAIREAEKSALEQDKHDDLMGQLMEQVAADKKDANSRAMNRISGKKEEKIDEEETKGEEDTTVVDPKNYIANQIGDITKLLFKNLVNLNGLEASDVVNKNYRGVNLLKGCLEASFALIQKYLGFYYHSFTTFTLCS